MRNKVTVKKRIDVVDVIVFLFLTIFAVLIVYPFYTAFATSLMSRQEMINTRIITVPKQLCWDNYAYMLSTPVIWTGYQSTLIITAIGLVYGMSISVTMAYAFSRPAFPGKRLLFMMMLFTMFFGGGLVPMYMQLKNLNLLNSRWAVILMMGVSPFNIIIIKSNFEAIPESLVEAAKVDGANELTIFFKIMLPLQTAVLATFALFISVSYWNEWFWSSLAINETRKMTLQVILKNIISSVSSNREAAARIETMNTVYDDGVKMAAVVVTMLPIMIVYPFLQKYFVKGVLVGAIKM